MKTTEVLSAYLEMEFRSAKSACVRLKALINDALDRGEWHEGFDIAVKKGELDRPECADLWDVIRRDFPESLQRMERNVASIRSHYDSALGQGMWIEWLVADDESVIATEGLRVARFVDGTLLWATEQLSLGGISLTSISNGEVLGEWYCPTPDADDWCPLRLAFADGALLEGEEIHWLPPEDWHSPEMDSAPMTADRASGRSLRLKSLRALWSKWTKRGRAIQK